MSTDNTLTPAEPTDLSDTLAEVVRARLASGEWRLLMVGKPPAGVLEALGEEYAAVTRPVMALFERTR